MNEDLKQIKDKFGEKMSHLCRELFPTLLETKGLLPKLLEDKFNPSKFLYEDIIAEKKEEQFKNYIYSLVDVENNNKIITHKSPFELMDEAGYILYECKGEEDIQSFKKYYAPGEALCTFDGNRLDRCHVFFAVKKNVSDIKRKDFINPTRQDEYGTSVISIQFTKGNRNTLSIKNRYNHTVNNPDATFSNNLENIIPGLTESFKKNYNLNINQNDNDFELDKYVKANDGKLYKYNYEIGNICYCPDNIIIDHNDMVKDYQEQKERYIVLDYFILDLKDKKIYLYDLIISDSFPDTVQNIDKIHIEKEKETDKRKILITTKDNNNIEIVVNKLNQIIEYKNEKIEYIGNGFLHQNKTLTSISLPNAKEIENNFLCDNESLISINFPNVKVIGDGFLARNNSLIKLNLPCTEIIGNSFLLNNNSLTALILPKVKDIKHYFLSTNMSLRIIDLQCAEIIGRDFLKYNSFLTQVNIPNLPELEQQLLSKNPNYEKRGKHL